MKKSFRFCLILLLTQQSFIKAQLCSMTIVPSSYSVCAGFQSTLTAFGSTSYSWTGTTFTVPVFSQTIAAGPGTYTVTGFTHTCTSVITIGVQPPLNIQLSQTSATSCIASGLPASSHPVTLMASGASVYSLYPSPASVAFTSNATVRPATSTCYTVVGATAVCSGSAVACVTIIPQFTIAVSPETTSICEGESVGLKVSQVGPDAMGSASAFIYTWTDADTTLTTSNSASLIVNPSGSKVYTVNVLDANHCMSAPATVSVTVNACTGISEQKNSASSFFPNPFNEYLNFNVSDVVLIEMSDALGKKVMTIRPGAENVYRVDTSNLLPGIYFFTVTNSARQKSQVKVIKN